MKRFEDWPARLEAFLARNRATEFRYGVWDCSTLVAGAIHSTTGVDLMASIPPYSSRRQARAIALNVCGQPSTAALAIHLFEAHHIEEIPALRAQRGDAVLVALEGLDDSLGIIALDGRSIWAAAAPGALRLPFSRARRAWRI